MPNKLRSHNEDKKGGDKGTRGGTFASNFEIEVK